MSKKILIVDDETMLTEALADYFQKEKHYAIFTAEDGEKAGEIIGKEDLDLVLLDMKLPKVDGIEVLKLLRQKYPKTKVIVMTCYDVEYKNKMDVVGYDYFFMKPLLIHDLQDKIQELLALDLAKGSQQVKPVSSKRETPTLYPQEKENIIPEAKILLIEPRINIKDLIKRFFEEETLSQGHYIVLMPNPASYTHVGGFDMSEIIQFSPDIVLYDIIQIGTFSSFASKLMQLEKPPKEIILFGDPSNKWEDVDAVIERGMEYVQTPLKVHDKFLGPEFALPSKETVQRLCSTVEKACLKYGLYKTKG